MSLAEPEPPQDDEKVLAALVGRRLREARLRTGRTMQQLADQAGVSQPFLSRLESGQSMPSVATLLRLCHALGATVHEIVEGPPAESVRVMRVGESAGRFRVRDRVVARSLVHGTADLQALEYTLDEGAVLGSHKHHGGTELVYVISGTMEIELDGRRVERLEPGDVVCHAATLPHTWRPVDAPLHVLCIVAPPLF